MKSLLKKSLIVGALTLAAGSALADWNTGASYTNLGFDDPDLSLGVVTANAGYTFDNIYSDWSVMPEIRLGTGVKGDEVSGFDIDVESFLVLATRFSYQATDATSFYIQPAYANLKIDGAEDGEWEFGVGVGSSFAINQDWDLEVMYEKYDDADLISFGTRYFF